MIRYYSIVICLLAAMTMASCSSPEKLLSKGRYENAINKGLKQYRSSKNKSALMTTITTAYKLTAEKAGHEIDRLHQSNDELRYEKILSEYKKLQALYKKISAYPEVSTQVNPEDYMYEINQFTAFATDMRYNRGVSLMQGNSKADYRNAYYEFEKALKLSPGDQDIQMRMQDALELAITHVAIDYPRFNERLVHQGYESLAHELNLDILRQMMRYNNKPFLKFHALVDAYGRGVQPDQFLYITFERLNVVRFRDDVDVRQVSKTIEKSIIKGDKLVTTTSTIHAEVITTTKRIKPQARVILTIVDHDNRAIWTDIVEEEHHWESVRVTYKGNRDALSDADWKLIQSSSQDIQPPSDRIFINDLMNSIQPKIYTSLNQAFSNY